MQSSDNVTPKTGYPTFMFHHLQEFYDLVTGDIVLKTDNPKFTFYRFQELYGVKTDEVQGGESRDLFWLFCTYIRTERVRKLCSSSLILN